MKTTKKDVELLQGLLPGFTFKGRSDDSRVWWDGVDQSPIWRVGDRTGDYVLCGEIKRALLARGFWYVIECDGDTDVTVGPLGDKDKFYRATAGDELRALLDVLAQMEGGR